MCLYKYLYVMNYLKVYIQRKFIELSFKKKIYSNQININFMYNKI